MSVKNPVAFIGQKVLGGTSGSIIFIDSNTAFAQDNTNLNFTDSTDTLQLGGFFEFGATNQTITTLKPFQFIDSTITMTQVIEVPMLDLKPTFVQGITGSGSGNQFSYVGILNRPTLKNPNASAFNFDIIGCVYDTPTLEADGQTVTCTGMLTFNSAPILTRINSGVLTVSNLFSFFSQASVNTGVTVTTRRGLSVSNFSGSGTVTTQTGVFISSLSGATNNFALETAGTTNSRFGGKLQLGSQAQVPTGMLDVLNIASTDVSILVTGAASQSANYLTINSSASVEQASISSAGTMNLLGNLTFTKELAHTISISNSTTSAAAGGALTILSGSATAGNANGGALTVATGGGNSLGAAGALTLQTGVGGVAPGAVLIQSQSVFSSGTVTVRSGNTTGANNSGGITVNSGTVTTAVAGNVAITGGAASGAGTGGNVTITAGNTVGGTNGAVTIVSSGVNAIVATAAGNVTMAQKVTSYNGITTVADGVSSILGTSDLTGQTAVVGATTLYTPTATGFYRITAYLQITTAATTSSILAGAGGVTVTYNDGDGNVAQTNTMQFTNQNGVAAISSAANSTTTNLKGVMVVYARTGVAISFSIGYNSVGATPMAYASHFKCESLG